MTEDNNTSFVDGESTDNYKGSELNFRSILLTHLARITKISSQEFHGGFWQDRYVGSATIHIYTPDTRQQYINSINCLSDMLLPYFDDEMTKAEEKNRQLLNDKYAELRKRMKEKGASVDSFNVAWSEEQQELKRELFRDLNLFMKRKNYLELGDLEE